MRARRLVPLLAAPVIFAACKVGYVPGAGLDEPLRVEGGQFFPGPLPTGGDAGPGVLAINSLDNLAFAGQAGKQLTGDVSGGSTAILMRFADLGTGYWSVPVGSPDPQMVGAITWSATCDFAWSIPPGTHDLLFSAIDADGNAGPSQSNPYVIEGVVPTGKVVISLVWDSAADLDLHVVTPSGAELSPKHPTTSLDGGPADGVLDRDSNANCVQDGFREEDAVFADRPPPGVYLIRVDMFAACGAPSADFVVRVRVDGDVTSTWEGRLLETDADNGGPGSGLLVNQLTVD